MQSLSERHHTKLRFALVGSINTALDFAILFLLTFGIHCPKELANIISTTLSFIFSFTANRTYTFRSSGGNLRKQLLLFTIVTLFGLWFIQTAIITLLAPTAHAAGLSASASLLISKLIATLASLTWNYLLYAKVVFTHSSAAK